MLDKAQTTAVAKDSQLRAAIARFRETAAKALAKPSIIDELSAGAKSTIISKLLRKVSSFHSKT